MRALPHGFGPDESFARRAAAAVPASSFHFDVAVVASTLAPAGSCINLCKDRYRFLVAFAAAISRGKTTLLPASHAPSAVAELVAAHPESTTLDDATVDVAGARSSFQCAPPADDFVAVVGHTSGSTGAPAAHAKTWAALFAVTTLNAATVRDAVRPSAGRQRPWIVATVPPQHMYGLELSVLLPLVGGFGIHSGKPLLPADVAVALGQVPAPRVLVSTPVHLRVLAESGVDFPEVAVVVSATAPLMKDAARRVERRFGARLTEMFGSTETCVVATRRTARQEYWRPYPRIRFEHATMGTVVHAPWFREPQLLQDILDSRPDGSFRVIGRHSDMVEIAGKRVSLADLTRRIASLPGVQDVHVFQPDARDRAGAARCAALVVAPGLSAQEILRQLRPGVDAVFLPRPLLVVPQLPRNEVGKLSIERAKALLTAASRSRREK